MYIKNWFDICPQESLQIKAALTISSLLSSLMISLLSFVPPVEKWEPNILSDEALLLVSIIIAANILLGMILLAKKKHKYSLIPAFWAIMLVIILFTIPLIKGYHLYAGRGGDILFHFAYIHEITSIGKLSNVRSDPLLHILSASLSYFGASDQLILTTMSSQFYMLTMLNIYILVSYLTKSKTKWGIFASIPLLWAPLHFTFQPAIYSVSIFPLFLYCLYRISERNFIILIIFIYISSILFHPISATVFLASSLIYLLLNKYYDKSLTTPVTGVILILSIIYTLWYIYSTIGSSFSLTVLTAFLKTGTGSTAASSKVAVIQELSTAKLIFNFIETYGAVVAYIFGSSLLISYHYYKKRLILSGYMLYFSLIFIVSIIYATLFFIFPLVIRHPLRATKFAAILSMIILSIGMVIYREKIGRPLHRNIGNFFIIIIVIVTLLSFSSFFVPDHHISEKEIKGVEWGVNYATDEKHYFSFRSGINWERYIKGETGPADTFIGPANNLYNYPYRSEKDSLKTDCSYYYTTKEYDKYHIKNKITELEEPSKNGCYNNKIYSNGGYTTWYPK